MIDKEEFKTINTNSVIRFSTFERILNYPNSHIRLVCIWKGGRCLVINSERIYLGTINRNIIHTNNLYLTISSGNAFIRECIEEVIKE